MRVYIASKLIWYLASSAIPSKIVNANQYYSLLYYSQTTTCILAVKVPNFGKNSWCIYGNPSISRCASWKPAGCTFIIEVKITSKLDQYECISVIIQKGSPSFLQPLLKDSLLFLFLFFFFFFLRIVGQPTLVCCDSTVVSLIIQKAHWSFGLSRPILREVGVWAALPLVHCQSAHAYRFHVFKWKFVTIALNLLFKVLEVWLNHTQNAMVS